MIHSLRLLTRWSTLDSGGLVGFADRFALRRSALAQVDRDTARVPTARNSLCQFCRDRAQKSALVR